MYALSFFGATIYALFIIHRFVLAVRKVYDADNNRLWSQDRHRDFDDHLPERRRQFVWRHSSSLCGVRRLAAEYRDPMDGIPGAGGTSSSGTKLSKRLGRRATDAWYQRHSFRDIISDIERIFFAFFSVSYHYSVYYYEYTNGSILRKHHYVCYCTTITS